MRDNLTLYALQKMHYALNKTKEQHIHNIRMLKPTERFLFSAPKLKTAKLRLIRLSVYNSKHNVKKE